ncbi:bifunctional nuclease family protein [Solitalea sp. MAHUQ-68]|uniref:Bifunctional nuclease family protein n=1 Tax=Solitalea agri TaxID=2953739 RepID=A0A9X2EYZ1_9SPHI|nr:bifunctional nuclease domain-containing protein [Solitalea agri]MCO4291537.1 bifunctional nuclease family protein [Solitalea agri]
MKKIKLDIVGLSYSQTQSGAYALVMGEVNGRRRLPIIIGGFEAQAIAIEIEKMTPTRPLTHDLFKSFAVAFNIQIQEVVIYNLVDGIFYAKLICFDGKRTLEVDARTSDAIALAVRFSCPIYTYEFILSQAGILIEGNEFVFLENVENKEEIPPVTPSGVSSYASLSDDDLKVQLKTALEEEAYEKAAKIRDELSRRKSS